MFKYIPLFVIVLAFVLFFVAGKYISKKYLLLGILSFFGIHAVQYCLRLNGIVIDELHMLKTWLLATGVILLIICAGYTCFNRKKTTFNPERRSALFAMGATLPAAYGVWQGVRIPEPVQHDFYSAKVQGSVKILQVTDMHISGLFGKTWCADMVATINAAKPDIVVFTGDMSDGFLQERYEDLQPLKDIKAPMYACLGNHEYFYDFKGFVKLFQELGMNILANEHATVNVRGQKLILAGITDLVAARGGYEMPDIDKALKGADPSLLTIMLNHRPNFTREIAAKGVDLQLSGHTHGGQFIPLNALVKHYNKGFLHGWYDIENMKLFVSSGAALWARAPFRLGVPGELPVFIVQNHSGKA